MKNRKPLRARAVLCAAALCVLLAASFRVGPAAVALEQPAESTTAGTEGFRPTCEPTAEPTCEPTAEPTCEPTAEPTCEPTAEPTSKPTAEPTCRPTAEPTSKPTAKPTSKPTAKPTCRPTPVPVPQTGATRANPALLLGAAGVCALAAGALCRRKF